MEALEIRPMQWAGVPDIDQAAPLSKDDELCFQEIRDVLKRHNALDRFGIALIHKHFEIADDEVMLEVTDQQSRTLTIRPTKRASVDEDHITVTNWQLADGEEVAVRVCVCARTSQGHTGGHTAA